MIPSNKEECEALETPLLRSEVDEAAVGTHYLTSFSSRMEAAPGAAGSSDIVIDSDQTMMSTGPMNHPFVRRGVMWLLQVRTAADVLPTIFQALATSGKWSAIGLIGFYLFFVSLWLPFWLFSFVVSEWGIYTLAFFTVFLVGRAIIRLIAFPGSSARVSTEIETEFAKYSVRMLVSSCNSLIDLASAILSTSKSGNQSTNNSGGGGGIGSGIDGVNASFSYYEIPGLWKRAKSYRDRVLGVYLDVLEFLLRPQEGASGTTNNAGSDVTKFGNNTLKGDIGNLSSITVSVQRIVLGRYYCYCTAVYRTPYSLVCLFIFAYFCFWNLQRIHNIPMFILCNVIQ